MAEFRCGRLHSQTPVCCWAGDISSVYQAGWHLLSYPETFLHRSGAGVEYGESWYSTWPRWSVQTPSRSQDRSDVTTWRLVYNHDGRSALSSSSRCCSRLRGRGAVLNCHALSHLDPSIYICLTRHLCAPFKLACSGLPQLGVIG